MSKETAKNDAVKGNGWVPPWMLDLGIEPGEALTLSKPQLRLLMRPNKPLKVQVWACGILHSPGYAGEIAWIMRDGRKVPLRSVDISRLLHAEAKQYYREAGIKDGGRFARLKESKQHIRAALASLDKDGASERERDDGTPFAKLTLRERQQLPAGRTRIRFFVRPRAADPEQVRQEWAARETISESDTQKVEVAKCSLPHPPIHQILKLFRIEAPGKSQISPDIYQKAVLLGYDAARKIFMDTVEAEVAKSSLPEGAAESLPEVASGSAAIRNSSRNTIEKDPPSVGRSVLTEEERLRRQAGEPTDRPMGKPAKNPFKPKIREWMKAQISIPGYPLEEPELDQIAATIHTEADLTQFQEAAKRQQNPRGWRVFVKIAERCRERGKAKPNGEGEDLDPSTERMLKLRTGVPRG